MILNLRELLHNRKSIYCGFIRDLVLVPQKTKKLMELPKTYIL